MTEKGAIQGLPVAAVNEDHNGTLAVAGKQIDVVPRAATIGNRAWRVPFAVFCRVFRPTCENRRVLRNARPVVVLDLVVDISVQDFTKLVLARISVPRPWSWPT